MWLKQKIYATVLCFILLNSCYSRHLISVQELPSYEKPAILYIELWRGEAVKYEINKVVLSKQDDDQLILFLEDGTTQTYLSADIKSIKIRQYEPVRTGGLVASLVISVASVLLIIGIVGSTVMTM